MVGSTEELMDNQGVGSSSLPAGLLTTGQTSKGNMIMDKFTVEITCGNDGMRSKADIAEALRKLADRIDSLYGPIQTMTISDPNGNTVGRADES
jgi:hypothetical protein